MFQDMVNKKGMSDRFFIDSAATSREEIGNGPHYGTISKLRSVGIPVVPHRARQMTKADYDDFDYLIGMDSYNTSNMVRIAGGDPEGKIFQMLDFAGLNRSIADPWYTGDFDATYTDVVEGCEGFLEYLRKEGKI
jgi:protein-tyrosine phosphatase